MVGVSVATVRSRPGSGHRAGRSGPAAGTGLRNGAPRGLGVATADRTLAGRGSVALRRRLGPGATVTGVAVPAAATGSPTAVAARTGAQFARTRPRTAAAGSACDGRNAG